MRLTCFGSCGAYPKENMGTSCYYVETDAKMVFDLGCGSLSRLSGFVKIEDIDALFISHFHSDHISDISVLRYFECYKQGQRLHVYMPKDDCVECQLFSAFPEFIVHYIEVGDYITLGRTKVKVVMADHVPNSVGYKITEMKRTIYYTGDTSFTNEMILNAKSSDLVIADCFIDTPSKLPSMKHCSVAEIKYLHDATGTKVLASHILPSHYDKVVKEIGLTNVIQELLTYEV